MTDKKEKLLSTALELFAREGYNAVSTSRIAKKAGVSEGLIFRHFENKKGLLDALVADAEKRLNEVFAHVVFETDPRQVIRKAIQLPFSVDKADYDYWKLQFKLKWEPEYNNPNKVKPLIDRLTWAFGELGAEGPEHEAVILQQLLDAISVAILRDGLDQRHLESFLLIKYNV
jgi:AcrR family transcriptional regulator